MGARGPIPANFGKNSTVIESDWAVTIPRTDNNWHPYAKQWYVGLMNSPQSTLYESSDWMQAFILADILSKMLLKGVYSSEMVKAFLAGSGELGVTLGDRKRMGIEIKHQATGGEEAPAVLDPYDEYEALAAAPEQATPPED